GRKPPRKDCGAFQRASSSSDAPGREDAMKSRTVPLVTTLVLAALAAPLASQEARVRLPVGVTLLGADSTGCSGTLMLESGIEARGEARRIPEGGYAVFQVSSPNVGWSCL